MSERPNLQAWTITVLVFLFMLTNYADKAVFGLSSTHIIKDLHLSHAQFGQLGSAFFLLFSISGVIIGFLANRANTKGIMLGMSIVWALALLPLSFVGTFSALFWSRVVLGAAEGPAFPIAVHAVYKWFGDSHRALPTSLVACGAAVGTGVIAPLLTWVITQYGWHATFGLLGVVGLTWAVLWLLVGADGPVASSAESDALVTRISYWRLIFSRTMIGVCLAGFAAYWIIALNIVWLANYLIKAMHLSPGEAAWIIAVPSILQMILAPALAYLSQKLTAFGVSTRVSRGLLGTACVVIAGGAMICLSIVGMGVAKVVLVGLSFSIGSVIFTLGATLIGEISPAPQRAAMLGIMNSFHTLAGLFAPIAMGFVVDIGTDPVAGFRTGYIDAGLLVVVLGLTAAMLINPAADLARFRRAAVTRLQAMG
ncbi:MFS transporter [Acidisoma cellulosilytica]|uniref:MFS transporter n=1 Tax=Acidisoma cellulosilyticum TaxID=2802395 RepID=A0A964E6T1_9PROT|nr:MFS transporter [Acidisoma cellulosilyticum]MCB8883904.1 MFS transporter [Acidisoma cellulosilyticum]